VQKYENFVPIGTSPPNIKPEQGFHIRLKKENEVNTLS